MDRLPRILAACGLGLLFTATGCRSTRSEVPPGRRFSNDGRQQKAIEFSSSGHPVSAAASAHFVPDSVGGSNLAAGIGAGASRPDPSAFGAPPGSFGAPGSSGLNQSPGLSRAPSDPAAMPASLPPAASPPAGLPSAPELNVAPPPMAAPMPNQVIQAPMETPGTMGQPNQAPSPN